MALRINKMHRQDTPALMYPSATQNHCVPLISDPDLGRDGSRPADSPQISQPCVSSFCFIFQTSSIGGKQWEPACCHADLEGVFGCRGLVLPWSQLPGLFTHPGTSGFHGWKLSGCCQPDTGSLCGWKDAVSPPNCLVSPFLSRLGKQVLSLISRIYCYLLLTL